MSANRASTLTRRTVDPLRSPLAAIRSYLMVPWNWLVRRPTLATVPPLANRDTEVDLMPQRLCDLQFRVGRGGENAVSGQRPRDWTRGATRLPEHGLAVYAPGRIGAPCRAENVSKNRRFDESPAVQARHAATRFTLDNCSY